MKPPRLSIPQINAILAMQAEVAPDTAVTCDKSYLAVVGGRTTLVISMSFDDQYDGRRSRTFAWDHYRGFVELPLNAIEAVGPAVRIVSAISS